MRTRELKFADSERRFVVFIGSKQVAQLLGQCMGAGGYETGGILIGYYTEMLRTAIVTAITGAPPDSRQGRTWFHRGIRGFQALILGLWARKRHYYLGEWHFHPSGSAEASSVDIRQMKAIACSPSYQCPEPILLIIGGDPVGTWSVRVSVFTCGGKSPIELARQDLHCDVARSS